MTLNTIFSVVGQYIFHFTWLMEVTSLLVSLYFFFSNTHIILVINNRPNKYIKYEGRKPKEERIRKMEESIGSSLAAWAKNN